MFKRIVLGKVYLSNVPNKYRWYTVVTQFNYEAKYIQNVKEGKYNDRTNLKDIVNVNGDERFDLIDNSLTWSSKGEDIFYKGTSTKSLPIKTTIKYYLDGKEYTSKELTGKSGKIKIVIEYENKYQW